MMRFSLILLIGFLMSSCGEPTATDTPAAPEPQEITDENPGQEAGTEMTSRGEVAPEAELVGEAAQMAAIREDFTRIQAAKNAGTLTKDSIHYYCEEMMMYGDVVMYADGSGVVLAVNAFTQGDHSGTTEHYYFRDGEPVFLFRESGTWRFGGEMTTSEDGTEVPGTIDNFTEDRLYFHKGSTIKALTKEYEVRNGEDIDPATIPNATMAHNGELPGNLDFVQSTIMTGKVDCKLVEE